MSKVKKASLMLEKAMNVIFTVCGFLTIAFVLLITGFLVVSGLPAIKEIGLIDFLFGTTCLMIRDVPVFAHYN